jgi:hypothetical protein
VRWILFPAYSNCVISFVKLFLLKAKQRQRVLPDPDFKQKTENQGVLCLMVKINVKDDKTFLAIKNFTKIKGMKIPGGSHKCVLDHTYHDENGNK